MQKQYGYRHCLEGTSNSGPHKLTPMISFVLFMISTKEDKYMCVPYTVQNWFRNKVLKKMLIQVNYM